MNKNPAEAVPLLRRMEYVRDALVPIPWAKNASGGPSMSETVQEAIAALSAPQGGGECQHKAQKWTADMRKGACQDCGASLPATPPAQQLGEVVTDEMVEAAEKERVRSLNAITAYGSAGVEERHLMAMRLALIAALTPKGDGNG